ncbi:hypothetical protein F4827_003092 [Paraburkholderia bannensis]|uniref:Uncharacterized protein n=1 Tax=Paraburkholderia bannensis TaxID=765414 RepID=A0A7W9TXJ9_9BURK|nr:MULTISPECIES: hypothetical protein [Paraburkholderia]MBB3258224.1 hypothetical protein [Paraburkholderia sp. WP4_3_2]MBB6103237.1 hypothetical protein [Paraburkholderia bannensis]
MAKWAFRAKEWLADRTGLQYPKLRVIQPVKPAVQFKFKDFVIGMQALALASVCLVTGILLLFVCGMLVYAIFVGLRG